MTARMHWEKNGGPACRVHRRHRRKNPWRLTFRVDEVTCMACVVILLKPLPTVGT